MTEDDLLSVGRQTIQSEAEALQKLANTLDEQFIQAVHQLYHIKTSHTNGQQGRIIVCGVGKSGHIGRKIAATLASTGNPAYFVHPTEAGHGDLGMITNNDVLLMLSKSGESSEFQLVLEYAKRHEIPIIAITANALSTLGKSAKIVLELPAIGESPTTDTSAPTNSTTMTLALGDALAITLLKFQGFSREDFAILHPGGKLGAQLSSVSAVMHIDDHMPLIDQEATVKDALIEISKKRFGCVGLYDQDKRLCGIITDGDLRRHLTLLSDVLRARAKDISSSRPRTVSANTLCAEAILMMEQNQITVLFVLDDDGIPVGIVHMHDLLRGKVR